MSEDRFKQLQDRLAQADRSHAVLVAREDAKRQERDQIDAKLRELGIDPEKADEEIVKLEREEAAALQEAETAISAYEARLKAALNTNKADLEMS